MSPADAPPPAAGPLVVAIGASNLSRGLPRLLAGVRAAGGPADVLVAAGHGRSFGANSRVAWRRLPSVLRSGLWRSLDRVVSDRGGRPVLALITDIGNDLLYGFTVEQTACWVRECADRLAARGARLAITGLPLASVARAGAVRYGLLRTVYVPGCPLSLGELRSAAERLDAAVRGIAADHAATLIEQPGGWYGFDSIHVRRRRLTDLWSAALEAWDMSPSTASMRASLGHWAWVGSSAAEVRSVAGVTRYTPQPVLHWPEGGSLSLY